MTAQVSSTTCINIATLFLPNTYMVCSCFLLYFSNNNQICKCFVTKSTKIIFNIPISKQQEKVCFFFQFNSTKSHLWNSEMYMIHMFLIFLYLITEANLPNKEVIEWLLPINLFISQTDSWNINIYSLAWYKIWMKHQIEPFTHKSGYSQVKYRI